MDRRGRRVSGRSGLREAAAPSAPRIHFIDYEPIRPDTLGARELGRNYCVEELGKPGFRGADRRQVREVPRGVKPRRREIYKKKPLFFCFNYLKYAPTRTKIY